MAQQQQKARAKGRKIGRNRKHQSTLYASGGRYERNKKRRMRRHMRDNPSDVFVRIRFERIGYGLASSHGLSSQGRRKLDRYQKLALASVS